MNLAFNVFIIIWVLFWVAAAVSEVYGVIREARMGNHQITAEDIDRAAPLAAVQMLSPEDRNLLRKAKMAHRVDELESHFKHTAALGWLLAENVLAVAVVAGIVMVALVVIAFCVWAGSFLFLHVGRGW